MGATVAETAPLTISLTTISVNSAPLPLKVDAVINVPALIDVSTLNEPVNCEPTIWDVTLNPASGVTSATTEAVTIWVTTTSVKSLPLPLNPEAVTALSTWIEPLNMEPLSTDVTLNIFSSVEAVTLPLAINGDTSASCVSAERGISNNLAPLPLNEPVCTFTSPKNIEPLSNDSTLNPSSFVTDAVTEPVTNLFESPEITAANVSSDCTEIAANGISVNLAPLPLNEEPLITPTSPKNVEPLAKDVTINPFSASTDAETEPLTNIFDSSDTKEVIDVCASSESAEKGISNNLSPLPLNEEPLCTLTSPKKVEPLSIEVTTNPSSGLTEAVTLPLTISVDNNASSVSAFFGISNKLAPLPLNTEPDDNLTSPKKVEPLSIEVTINPSSASTEAVTEPLINIFDSSDTNDWIDSCASVESAENGISNNFSPLPLNTEPLCTLTSPINVEPLSIEVTTKPSSGVTDAVTLPLTINDDNNASGVNAALGISNKLAPLPLNEPVWSFTSPKKVEPLATDVIMNPSSESTEAVTLPLTNILDVSDTNDWIDSCASSDNAENGISLKFSPLPLKAEPLSTLTSPKNVEPLSIEVTTNPSSGVTDAVTEPDTMKEDNNESGVNAALGISNNNAPLPLNEPVWSFTSPKNVEPLWVDVTMKPSSASTEAVTLPLTNIFDSSDTNDVMDACASSESAEKGMLNNSSPLPLKVEPLLILTPPLTKRDELNSALSVPSNLKPKLGSTDAVTEPLTINDDNNASGVNAAFGISNRLAPLPLKVEPLFISTFPLINKEPVNWEPLSIEVTMNPLVSSTDAVTFPSAILEDCSAAGKLNSWEPSPIKNDDETTDEVTLLVDISPLTISEPLISPLPLTDKSLDIFVLPSTSNEPVISTEPVNSCKLPVELPNLFEPDENMIEDEIISTIISLATIRLSTNKSPVILTSPSISISPSNDEDTFTKNPVFGAIDADADPLINWDEKGKLFNLEPSPSNEPENEPLNSSNCIFVINKRLPSISEAISATEPLSILPLRGTPKLGSASCNDR